MDEIISLKDPSQPFLSAPTIQASDTQGTQTKPTVTTPPTEEGMKSLKDYQIHPAAINYSSFYKWAIKAIEEQASYEEEYDEKQTAYITQALQWAIKLESLTDKETANAYCHLISSLESLLATGLYSPKGLSFDKKKVLDAVYQLFSRPDWVKHLSLSDFKKIIETVRNILSGLQYNDRETYQWNYDVFEHLYKTLRTPSEHRVFLIQAEIYIWNREPKDLTETYQKKLRVLCHLARFHCRIKLESNKESYLNLIRILWDDNYKQEAVCFYNYEKERCTDSFIQDRLAGLGKEMLPYIACVEKKAKAQAIFLKAKSSFANENYAKALIPLKSLFESKPNFVLGAPWYSLSDKEQVETYFMQGMCYEKIGNHEQQAVLWYTNTYRHGAFKQLDISIQNKVQDYAISQTIGKILSSSDPILENSNASVWAYLGVNAYQSIIDHDLFYLLSSREQFKVYASLAFCIAADLETSNMTSPACKKWEKVQSLLEQAKATQGESNQVNHILDNYLSPMARLGEHHMFLKDFNAAIRCFNEVLEMINAHRKDPSQWTVIQKSVYQAAFYAIGCCYERQISPWVDGEKTEELYKKAWAYYEQAPVKGCGEDQHGEENKRAFIQKYIAYMQRNPNFVLNILDNEVKPSNRQERRQLEKKAKKKAEKVKKASAKKTQPPAKVDKKDVKEKTNKKDKKKTVSSEPAVEVPAPPAATTPATSTATVTTTTTTTTTDTSPTPVTVPEVVSPLPSEDESVYNQFISQFSPEFIQCLQDTGTSNRNSRKLRGGSKRESVQEDPKRRSVKHEFLSRQVSEKHLRRRGSQRDIRTGAKQLKLDPFKKAMAKVPLLESEHIWTDINTLLSEWPHVSSGLNLTPFKDDLKGIYEIYAGRGQAYRVLFMHKVIQEESKLILVTVFHKDSQKTPAEIKTLAKNARDEVEKIV